MKNVVRLISSSFSRKTQAPRSREVLSFAERLSRRVPAAVSALAWAGALVFSAWVASGWIWNRAAPEAVHYSAATETDPLVVAQAVAARHLMGATGPQSDDKAAGRQGSFRLLGLMTASDRWPGFAILSQDGKESLVVTEGEEIVPGASLAKVLGDRVLIRRDGTTETLLLVQP